MKLKIVADDDPSATHECDGRNIDNGRVMCVHRIEPQPKTNAELAREIYDDTNHDVAYRYARLLDAVDAKIAAALKGEK